MLYIYIYLCQWERFLLFLNSHRSRKSYRWYWINIIYIRRNIFSISFKLVHYCIVSSWNMPDYKIGEELITLLQFVQVDRKRWLFCRVDIIFTNWKQSTLNPISEICKISMHFIAQINTSHYECRSDKIWQIS